jgi:hypothetical protein
MKMKIDVNSSELPLLTISLSFIFWFGLYFGLYFAGWPGEAHECVNPPYCFCEATYPGTLAAQKSNTWSDLGFVLVAIFMAIHGSKVLRQQKIDNNGSYKQNPALIALYSSVIFFMGPGSMFFHGSMTVWGGMLDVISMYLFVLFAICYLIFRSWNLSIKFFYLAYFPLCLIFILVSIFIHGLTPKIFPFVAGLLIFLALLQSIPFKKVKLGRHRDLGLEGKWLALALGFFVTAATIWKFSDTGGPLCYPESLLQGHAAWHILSACMTLCIHFYFLSEKDKQAIA